ncbi:MAG TPA: hypothetical protein DET40_24690 [Lentisphaeria bacterium]|nr:MAG: hypothetical protein A2X45_01315 [Lentisphaerae bacterium GWF2_50_93]HCE46758.1 hypothetical protein [Lentisphaeria bacterium]
MKRLIFPAVLVIMAFFAYAAPLPPSKEDAVSLVALTVSDIEQDAPGTIKRIIKGEDTYWDRENREFLVFVMNEEVRVVAHPLKMHLMKMYSEEKDNEGKTYRKDAVVNAMASGSGWVSFSINTKDGKKTMESFYKIVKGSDKKNYIVCCDIEKTAESKQ